MDLHCTYMKREAGQYKMAESYDILYDWLAEPEEE